MAKEDKSANPINEKVTLSVNKKPTKSISLKPTLDKQYIISELLHNLEVLDEAICSGEYNRESKYFLTEKRETLMTLYKLIDGDSAADNTITVNISMIE